jgi:hypothetical protein
MKALWFLVPTPFLKIKENEELQLEVVTIEIKSLQMADKGRQRHAKLNCKKGSLDFKTLYKAVIGRSIKRLI